MKEWALYGYHAVEDREAWHAAVHGWQELAQLSEWTTIYRRTRTGYRYLEAETSRKITKKNTTVTYIKILSMVKQWVLPIQVSKS